MESTISQMIAAYDQGKLTRRQLVSRVSALAGLGLGIGAGAAAEDTDSTFRAVGLNHLALDTTDVERSRDFYVRHLGLRVARESLPHSCFLECGANFVALFRARQAGMDHYCYSVPDYDQRQAADRLRAVGLEPRLQGDRIYFQDPDGLTVQLAGPSHTASR